MTSWYLFALGSKVQSKFLKESLKNVDGILLRTSKLDQDILQHCDNLKIISRHGVGYDNVDLDFLKDVYTSSLVKGWDGKIKDKIQ